MRVTSDLEYIKPLEIGKTRVYIRTNFERIVKDGITLTEYDEEQIPKDDFIARLQNENNSLKEEVTLLQEVTFDAMVASEETKAELLNLQEIVFDLIVNREGAV